MLVLFQATPFQYSAPRPGPTTSVPEDICENEKGDVCEKDEKLKKRQMQKLLKIFKAHFGHEVLNKG